MMLRSKHDNKFHIERSISTRCNITHIISLEVCTLLQQTSSSLAHTAQTLNILLHAKVGSNNIILQMNLALYRIQFQVVFQSTRSVQRMVEVPQNTLRLNSVILQLLQHSNRYTRILFMVQQASLLTQPNGKVSTCSLSRLKRTSSVDFEASIVTTSPVKPAFSPSTTFTRAPIA